MPNDLRDVGQFWSGMVESATFTPVGFSCPGGACILTGVAKLPTITAYNPAAPDAVVDVESPTNGTTLFTGGSLSILNSTQNQTSLSGSFIPHVAFSSNLSLPWPVEISYANPHGAANGTFNVSLDGRTIDFVRLRSFAGLVQVDLEVRLGVGTHRLLTTEVLHNPVSTSRSTESVTFNVTNTFSNLSFSYNVGAGPYPYDSELVAGASNATFTVRSHALGVVASGAATPAADVGQFDVSLEVALGLVAGPSETVRVILPIQLTPNGAGGLFELSVTLELQLGVGDPVNASFTTFGTFSGPP